MVFCKICDSFSSKRDEHMENLQRFLKDGKVNGRKREGDKIEECFDLFR